MNSFIQKYYTIIFLVFIAIIIGLAFGVGYQEGKVASPSASNNIVFSCPNTVLDKLKITPQKNILSDTSSISGDVTLKSQTQNGGAYLGSKNGTKYYTPGCPGANRIKPANIIWFQTVEDATLQGYSKGSC